VIEEDSARGSPGFVNLAGIESPRLTAAPRRSGALRRRAAPVVHADSFERHVLVMHPVDIAIAGAAEIGDISEARQRVARDAPEASAEAVAYFVGPPAGASSTAMGGGACRFVDGWVASARLALH
jgi:hypothetical protein